MIDIPPFPQELPEVEHLLLVRHCDKPDCPVCAGKPVTIAEVVRRMAERP